MYIFLERLLLGWRFCAMAAASRPVRLIQLDGRCGCEYERSESTDARCLTARTAES
ncbi:Histone H3 [Zea mays]|jgi:hypothetical protein|uniref:Histone H3 n=1 Tax=Zea mays TaxID=4577 RepID=A0A1D6HB41_MAIZE|nr:Histone H3 [Zea mays]